MNISEIIRKFVDSEPQILETSKIQKRGSENEDSSYLTALVTLKNHDGWLSNKSLAEKVFVRLQNIKPKTAEESLKVMELFQRIFQNNYGGTRYNLPPLDSKNEFEELISELRNNSISIFSDTLYVRYSEFPERQFDCLNKLVHFFSKNYPHSPLRDFQFEGKIDLDRFINFVESNPNIVSLGLDCRNVDDACLEILSKKLPKIENFSIYHNDLITTLPKEILNRVQKLYIVDCEAVKNFETNAVRLNCSGCYNLETFEAPNATQIKCINCPQLKVINADLANITCKGCKSLTAIKTNGKKVECKESPALITIEANEAEEVECSQCPNLTKIEVRNAKYLDCMRCTALTTIEATKLTSVNNYLCNSLLPNVKFNLSKTIYKNNMHNLSTNTCDPALFLGSLSRKINNLDVVDYTNFPFLQLLLDITGLTVPIEFSSEEEKIKCESALDSYLIQLFDYIESNFKNVDINKFKAIFISSSEACGLD